MSTGEAVSKQPGFVYSKLFAWCCLLQMSKYQMFWMSCVSQKKKPSPVWMDMLTNKRSDLGPY